MHDSHHNTYDDVEKLAVVACFCEVCFEALVSHSQYLIKRRIDQAYKQDKGKYTLRMRNANWLGARPVNIKEIVDVDVLDVNHEHYHLATVKE